MIFDLNMGLEELPDVPTAQGLQSHPHHEASGRLNREPRNHPGPRGLGRGIAMFSIPLKKALLCNPAVRPKSTLSKKKYAHELDRKENGVGSSGSVSLTVDDKASAMLMRASGITGDHEAPTEVAHQQFVGQFVDPMQAGLAGGLRDVFGMQQIGNGGSLEVLVADADE